MEKIIDIYKAHKFYFNSFLILFSLGLVLNLFFVKGEILIYINQFRGEFLGQSMRYLTMFGEAPMYLILALGFLFVRFRISLAISLTGLIGLIVSFLLKKVYSNPRPRTYFKDTEIWEQLSWVGGAFPVSGAFTSYPSGHTLSAFALFGIIALSFKNKGLYLFMLFLAITVAFSRVYLMHHFYIDVLSGSLVGVFLSMGIYTICGYDSEKYKILDLNIQTYKRKNLST